MNKVAHHARKPGWALEGKERPKAPCGSCKPGALENRDGGQTVFFLSRCAETRTRNGAVFRHCCPNVISEPGIQGPGPNGDRPYRRWARGRVPCGAAGLVFPLHPSVKGSLVRKPRLDSPRMPGAPRRTNSAPCDWLTQAQVLLFDPRRGRAGHWHEFWRGAAASKRRRSGCPALPRRAGAVMALFAASPRQFPPPFAILWQFCCKIRMAMLTGHGFQAQVVFLKGRPPSAGLGTCGLTSWGRSRFTSSNLPRPRSEPPGTLVPDSPRSTPFIPPHRNCPLSSSCGSPRPSRHIARRCKTARDPRSLTSIPRPSAQAPPNSRPSLARAFAG